MSSESRIAVAVSPFHANLNEPAPPTLHPLWRAALEAERGGLDPVHIGHIWDDILDGRLRVWGESVGDGCIRLLVRSAAAGRLVAAEDAALVARLLSGESQKLVAFESKIAPSTASGRYVRALRRLGLSPRCVPLAVVLAAQGASGFGPITTPRCGLIQHPNGTCVLVTVPRTAGARLEPLTKAEREVAQSIIDGRSRGEIAAARDTSANTVARQFHSIFDRLGVGGRYALIRRAVELGGFTEG